LVTTAMLELASQPAPIEITLPGTVIWKGTPGQQLARGGEGDGEIAARTHRGDMYSARQAGPDRNIARPMVAVAQLACVAQAPGQDLARRGDRHRELETRASRGAFDPFGSRTRTGRSRPDLAPFPSSPCCPRPPRPDLPARRDTDAELTHPGGGNPQISRFRQPDYGECPSASAPPARLQPA
jgi:hypothetical protein